MIIMSEDFKRKLKDYAEGRLTEEESKEMEAELEKMEEYQAFLDGELDKGSMRKINKDNVMPVKDEGKILRRGRWKARIQNALAALGIIIAASIVTGTITSVFYTMGKTPRLEIYRDVVRSTVAVTQPNIRFSNGGSSVGSYLSMKMDGGLYKRVGREDIRVGEMNITFLLGQAGYPDRKWLTEKGNMDNSAVFSYPLSDYESSDKEWERLEKLPEGTVAEAYISLDKLYGTGEILEKFKGRDVDPLWFAVDTGFDNPEDGKGLPNPMFTIGFPSQPIWHSGDWTTTDIKEEKTGIISRVVSHIKEAPEYDPYGSEELRNKNFLDTLNLMKKYEKIADRISYGSRLNLEDRIEYVNEHGINIYGVVVTGPTKEVLKLRDETWAAGIRIGEVRLWNWD